VVFTALAGVVFAELRRRSGSLVAPLLLHWATNGLAWSRPAGCGRSARRCRLRRRARPGREELLAVDLPLLDGPLDRRKLLGGLPAGRRPR
jgi:membrane protease YdiL (CAAX protease family)